MRPFLLLLALPALGLAQTPPKGPPSLPAVRLAKPPVIDGELSEGEWTEASKVDGFVDRLTLRATDDRTEAWIGYDAQAIYVAVRCYTRFPAGIVAREVQRGADLDADDHVTFSINPFGNRVYSGTSEFSVNAIGTQEESIAGGRASKREWRGEWNAAAKIVSDGWTAEMRIPWKILNYPRGAKLAMDFQIDRYQARGQIRSGWPDISFSERPELRARWLEVEPPPVSETKKLSVLPYATAEAGEETGFRSGFDARYLLSPQVTGLLSVNPDFKNIEEAIAGIDFTRTERFLDEVRPFFTEGGDFFRFGSGFGYGQLFYSRRIEQFDVGAKAFGRVTPSLSAGALATYDHDHQTVGLARIRQEFGPNHSLGLFTSANQEAGLQENVMGIGYYRKVGSFGVSVNGAGLRQNADRLQGAGDVGIEYGVPHIFSLLRYEAINARFDPSLGFIPWTDRRGYYNYTDFGWSYRTSPLRYFSINGGWSEFFTDDRQVQEKGYNLFTSVGLRNDMNLNLGHDETRYYGEPDNVWSGGVTFNSSDRFRRLEVFGETGLRAGSRSNFIGVNLSRRIARGLDLGISQSVLKYDGTDSLTIATLGYELGPTRSLNGRFVSRNGKTNLYAAFRQSGGTGAEYFLILGDPNAETSVARVAVKVVWAF